MRKLLQIVPMACPSRNWDRYVDPDSFGGSLHDLLVLLGRLQNLDPLPRTVSEALQVDWQSQTCGVTSGVSEILSFCNCWGTPEFLWAEEDPGREKQLACIRRDRPPRQWRSASLVLMMSHFQGCHHDTIAHWYFSSTPAQASWVPKGTQISHNLAWHTVSSWLHGA